MARKPIWSRACCTSPPPHSHSALCTSHTHLLTISLCTPTFSQSYHLTLRSSTFSLPTFHTPSNTNSLIFSPYHSAHPPSHNVTLSIITPHTLYNQYQHFHFSFSHSTHPPSHNLTLSHCHTLHMQHPPSDHLILCTIHLLKSSPCHHCANVPESVHLQAPKLSSPLYGSHLVLA